MGALDMRVIDLKQRQRLNKINDTMMMNETDGEQAAYYDTKNLSLGNIFNTKIMVTGTGTIFLKHFLCI